MRAKYRYALVDFYEGDVDIVAVVPTKQALRKAYNERWEDTDGECDLRGFDLTTREKRKEFRKHYHYMKEVWGE